MENKIKIGLIVLLLGVILVGWHIQKDYDENKQVINYTGVVNLAITSKNIHQCDVLSNTTNCSPGRGNAGYIAYLKCLNDFTPREECYIKYISRYPDEAICENIKQGNYSFSPAVGPKKTLRDQCFYIVAMKTNNSALCSKIENEYPDCYMSIAIKFSNILPCEKEPTLDKKERCYYYVAKEIKDPSVCEKITQQHLREDCYKIVRSNVNELTQQEKISCQQKYEELITNFKNLYYNYSSPTDFYFILPKPILPEDDVGLALKDMNKSFDIGVYAIGESYTWINGYCGPGSSGGDKCRPETKRVPTVIFGLKDSSQKTIEIQKNKFGSVVPINNSFYRLKGVMTFTSSEGWPYDPKTGTYMKIAQKRGYAKFIIEGIEKLDCV